MMKSLPGVSGAIQHARSLIRALRGASRPRAPRVVSLEPLPPDPTLEALEVLGSVRDVQRHCCELAKKNHPDLDWAEFGVSRGWSASFFLEHLPADRRLYLFDSWDGLPEEWEQVEEGRYRSAVPSFKDGRAHLVKGLFSETLDGWVPTQRSPLAFIHMDADLYSSTICVLDAITPLIVAGTVILFDEYYNYPGWRNHEYKAFHEFIQATGHSFQYLGKSDKHNAFPNRERKTSMYVRVAVEIV